jgi:Flp pilus assembly protein TadG
MTHTRITMLAVFALVGLGAGTAAAQERRLKKSDLPAAVQRAADAQSAGATVRGYSSETENGKLIYEVQLTVAGHSKDVSIAADGTVLEVEEQVVFDSLPAAVRDGLKAKAGTGTITRVESLTKGGRLVAYEAQVRTGTKRSEIQVGPDGKPLAHEE